MDQSLSPNITIHVDPDFVALISESELVKVVIDTLVEGETSTDAQVIIVITDDEEIQRLNNQFRGIDNTTDVLAFGFKTQGVYYGSDSPTSFWDEDEEFILPPDITTALDLGEIFISFPQAQKQAKTSNISTQKELNHFLSHGVLHLLGYDHRDPNEEHEMNLKIDEALKNGSGND